MKVEIGNIEVLGVLRTEKGITIVNPDTGFIISQTNYPIKPKNTERIKSMYPIDEMELVSNNKEVVTN